MDNTTLLKQRIYELEYMVAQRDKKIKELESRQVVYCDKPNPMSMFKENDTMYKFPKLHSYTPAGQTVFHEDAFTTQVSFRPYKNEFD